MRTVFRRAFGRVGSAVALSLAVLTLAACGSAAQPTTDAPQPTATPAAAAADTTPAQLRAAPKFKLPDTSGEAVSLDSYMGNRNVVVIFYRGFW